MRWFNRFFKEARVRAPIDDALWREIEGRLPCLDRFDPNARHRLRAMALEFLATKEFHGADGLVVTDSMRAAIALQACLPVLELGLSAYKDWLGIVVYNGEFVAQRQVLDEDGIEHQYEETALGEASEFGPVVLGWFDDDAAYDGANVVIHEFVHKLDMLNGEADGCPPLHAGMSNEIWDSTFDQAYNHFCDRIDAGDETLIDPYASDDPAEFFAV